MNQLFDITLYCLLDGNQRITYAVCQFAVFFFIYVCVLLVCVCAVDLGDSAYIMVLQTLQVQPGDTAT